MTPAFRAQSNDHLAIALFLAILLHMGLLAVHFDFTPPTPASSSLEITLASYSEAQAPDDADFLAQHHQLGSGSTDDKRAPSTRSPAPLPSEKSHPVQPEQRLAAQPDTAVDSRVITTLGRTRETTARVLREEQQVDVMTAEAQVSLWQRSLEIASLEAQLRETEQLHARGPRTRQLTAASAKQARDAYYLDAWRHKVETVGNLNYPAEARRRQLFGELRLMVAVRADGSLAEVRILKSSGQRVLDDAAIRIVQLAAPYAPFPPELKRDTDVLEIVRTWRFEQGHHMSSF